MRKPHLLRIAVFLSFIGLIVGPGLAASAPNNVPASPQLEQQIRNQIALRQSLHFRSDIGHIRTLLATPDAVKLEAVDAVFTRAEAAELLTRLDLQQDGATIQEFFTAHAELREAFGGLYIDHAVGGKLVLQLVQAHARAKDIPSILPPVLHRDRIQIMHVAWPNSQLHQQFDSISHVLEQYDGIVALALDEVGNQVVAVVNSSVASIPTGTIVTKDTLPTNLARLLADPAVIVRAGEVEGEDQAVRAGYGITIGGSLCTLAFEVVHNNKPAALTAGHCVSNKAIGTKAFHIDNAFGTYNGNFMYGSATNSGFGVDVGIIQLNDAAAVTDDIYRGASPTLDVTGALASTSYVPGYTYCMRGTKSGNVCGPITSGSFNYLFNNVWFRDMFAIDAQTQGGDSGGPYYQKSSWSDTALAVGIHKGTVDIAGITNGPDPNASKWHTTASWFGLTLVTTD